MGERMSPELKRGREFIRGRQVSYTIALVEHEQSVQPAELLQLGESNLDDRGLHLQIRISNQLSKPLREYWALSTAFAASYIAEKPKEAYIIAEDTMVRRFLPNELLKSYVTSRKEYFEDLLLRTAAEPTDTDISVIKSVYHYLKKLADIRFTD